MADHVLFCSSKAGILAQTAKKRLACILKSVYRSICVKWSLLILAAIQNGGKRHEEQFPKAQGTRVAVK